MDKIRSLLGLKSTLFTLAFNSASNKISMKSLGSSAETETLQGLYAMTAAGDKTQLQSEEITIIGASGTRTLGKDNIADVMIEGYGYGHGVGLSQVGAINMAKAGYLYKDILQHYYFSNSGFSFGNLY